MRTKVNLKILSLLFLLIAISAGVVAFDCYNSGSCASAPPSFSPPPSYAPQNNYAPSVVPQGPNEPSSAPTYTYVPSLIPATDVPAPPSSAPHNNYTPNIISASTSATAPSSAPLLTPASVSPSPTNITNAAIILPSTKSATAPSTSTETISRPSDVGKNQTIEPLEVKPYDYQVQNTKNTNTAPLATQSFLVSGNYETRPVIRFPFNGNFLDFSGNTYNNAGQNVQFTYEGVDGQSASFDGSTSNIPINSFNWPAKSRASVMFWMKIPKSDTRHGMLFGIGSENYTNRFLGAPWGDGFFYWDYGDISTKGRLKFDYRPYLDKWVHVTLVSQGTAGAQRSIYINGNLVAQENSSDSPKMNLAGLNIGRGWGGSQWHYYNGLIDEFRIYYSSLSPEYIKYEYGEQKMRLVENAPIPTCSFESVTYHQSDKQRPVIFSVTGTNPSGVKSLTLNYGDGTQSVIDKFNILPRTLEHRYEAYGPTFTATLYTTGFDNTKSEMCTYQIKFENTTCTPNFSTVCSTDNLYWQNSCGQIEELKEFCVSGCNPSTNSCNVVQKVCSETDNGLDKYKYGETISKGITQKDSCNGSSVLENYCNQGSIWQAPLDCPYGCSNGACNSAPTCTPNARVGCFNNNEYWFDSCGQIENLKQSCPNGCDVQTNSCRIPQSTCTETDGGENPYLYGQTTIDGFTINDRCENGDDVRELFCSQNYITSTVTKCLYGCSNGACNQTPSNPQCRLNSSSTCYNDDVYWYNSCNQRGDKREECGSVGCSSGACNSTRSEPGDLDYCSSSNLCRQGEGDCDSDSQCRSGLSCVNNVGADYGFDESIDVCESDTQTCDSQDYVACYNNDEYWYDSCGARENKAKECGTLGCSNNSCNTNSGPTCRSNDHTACYLGDAYWFNSCGNMGSKKEECGNNACSNGVCNAKPEPLNAGWYCKNSSTMAYKVDGQWTNELSCALGCSDNKCNHPLSWILHNSNPNSSKIGLTNTNTAIQPQFISVIQSLIALAGQIFTQATVHGGRLLVMFGTIVLANESGTFSFYEWPDYDDTWVYDEPYFKDHYNRHVRLIENLYGRSLNEQAYKDFCKDKMNEGINKLKQNDGLFVSLDIGTGLTVVGTKDGKIVTCFINDKKTIINNFKSNRWVPIATFNKVLFI